MVVVVEEEERRRKGRARNERKSITLPSHKRSVFSTRAWNVCIEVHSNLVNETCFNVNRRVQARGANVV